MGMANVGESVRTREGVRERERESANMTNRELLREWERTRVIESANETQYERERRSNRLQE